MNRLSPLIVRSSAARHPMRAWAVETVPEANPKWLTDLRFFATGWIGGLIFFGTLLA
jgi:hypothetical protein